MSIKRNRTRTPETTAPTPQIAPIPATSYPRIEARTPSESNGYLDPDQTLVNFAVREMGMSFQQLIADDPSRLLRNWLKCYRGARATAIGTLALGTGAMILGIGTGAIPLSIAGFITLGSSGMLIKHHTAGVRACEMEASILDEIRPVLELFHSLEVRGANPSDLVSLYDRLIRQYAAQNPMFGSIGDPKGLKEFFKVELDKHLTLSSVANAQTGLAAAALTQPAQPAIAPTPIPAPIPLPSPLPATDPEPVQPEPLIPVSGVQSTPPTPPVSANFQAQVEETLTAVATMEPLTTDLAALMAESVKTTIIAASPRTGKGILVATAGRKVQELRPDFEIWLIDPKNEPKESGYWSFVDMDKRIHFDLRDYSLDIDRVEGLLDGFLTRFNASSARSKLLITDEFVGLNSRLGKFMSRFKDFLVSISSSGEVGLEGEGKFAWIVTQSPYVVDIGFRTKGLRASFNRILMFDKNHTDFIDLANSTDFCPTLEASERHKLTAQTGRAFYYSLGDKWGSLATYSTFEPDLRTSELSHPFRPVQAQTEAGNQTNESTQEQPEPPLKNVDEIANKLLTWLKGSGQQYFVNGFIPGSEILDKFAYWSEGKTRKVKKEQLTPIMWVLVNNNQAEVVRGMGVKLINGEDDLGLFT